MTAPSLPQLVDQLTRQLWSLRRTAIYDRSTNIARDLRRALADVNEPRRLAGLPPITERDAESYLGEMTEPADDSSPETA